MNRVKQRLRQVMDWSAAIRAGLLAGAIFLVASMILTMLYVGSPWVVLRLIASLVLGTAILPPPASFDPGIAVVAVAIHLLIAMAVTLLISGTLHRWGLVVGILGGAVFGLAIYLINFYALSYLVPWFFPMKSWIMLLSHVLFGALAGGTYEALEVEKFVPVED